MWGQTDVTFMSVGDFREIINQCLKINADDLLKNHMLVLLIKNHKGFSSFILRSAFPSTADV